jgi:GTP-binding protein EngB required for normal cell division
MYTLFFGDPGVGKSTLLNALNGQSVFQSGLSFGSGLTQHMRSHTDGDGNVWADTPGLSDVMIQEHAAAEIEKALKESAQYQEMKLVFVTTWSNGRVLPNNTIELVLNALPSHKQISIGIIVNKITARNVVHFKSNPQEYQSVVNGLYKGIDNRCHGRHVLFYERMGELEDAADKLHIPTADLKAFLDALPTNSVSATDVCKVEDVEAKKRREELKKQEHEKVRELEKLVKEQAQRAEAQGRTRRENETRQEQERLQCQRKQQVEQERIKYMQELCQEQERLRLRREKEDELQSILDEDNRRHKIALAEASGGSDCVVL